MLPFVRRSKSRPPHWLITRFKSDVNSNKHLQPRKQTNNNNTPAPASDTSSTSSSSKAAPAPWTSQTSVSHLLKKNTKPYVPKLKHDRLTYEYPGLPNKDEYTTKIKPTKTTTRWSRYLPKMLGVLVLVWGGYTIKVWFYPPDEGGEDARELLSPNKFHKFIITHKEQIDDDHFLIEIQPKYTHWQYSYILNYESKTIWNGDRIWSVEVKHPDISVVRSYTPLPFYFMKSEYTRRGERKPMLRVIHNENVDYDMNGVMTLYVKRYNDGEVSRYITSKNIGEEIELRGPYEEYKFPYHPGKKYHQRPTFKDLPSHIESEHMAERARQLNRVPKYDNITFYGAGTGIAPLLQLVFSRNPYRGFITVHYSAQKPGELKPFERYLFFLEKLDRVKLNYHYDSEPSSKLKQSDIEKPGKPHFITDKQKQEMNKLTETEQLKYRLQLLEQDQGKVQDQDQQSNLTRGPRYENALQYAQVTSKLLKDASSFAIVCGPQGYMEYVCGSKVLNTGEQGPVEGLLAKKGWNSANVFKL
ncbi:mitochondrial peripheral inner membrane protein [Scheffersomyces spartinae]|uniref:Mitochondrial peripheral inner membrane protein n=1 Tax=Scheffersomyces spartinae TaxID=45513 RepID=A0A9P8AIB6_9ASCO|nr:mitochondrial peripheral inner membrane protein [Scheffersomyces spartinae]KAG7193484.1 mitochondrial peripheral inner membrane protein [Scheffersomyces spartinae]